ncbi:MULTISPECIES: flagellar hook-associated protein FlgK [Kordiimonas]|jgi:flagellar hook-associated protein 1 FlgK|uniref:flagellar hook-associated protein FlgK n=1 Tax=Kordiimonas TaxID=288021 RepID=UPI00257FA41A|nr:flagellar hook-associated protein FlgK [Kordiimonas sp. UBA4487]
MSINGIINTSLSGLFTNQAAIQATSNNIANVNTEGYARVVVETEANILQGQSSGVSISDIKRVVDKFLESALQTSTSNLSEVTVQREFHDRLQGILGDPASDSSLAARMDQIYQAMADLALNPADVLRRQQMLSEIGSFTDQINLYHDQIQSLRSEASTQMAETVNAINTTLQRIDELNPLLVRASALGEESGGLEGQLSLALNELASLIDIKIERTAAGGVKIATGDGYPLLDTSLFQLEYDAPGIVEAGTTFPTIDVYRVNDDGEQISSTVDLTPHIRSGKLKGLMEMRDNQLVDLSVTLGELSARAMDEFNAIQNKYSAVPAPNSMEGKQTFVDGAHQTGFTGQTTFAVVDANNQLVNSVTVDFSDTGTYPDFDAVVTAVNAALGADGTLALNNGVMSFTATNSANGVVIADDEADPSDRAGRGFSHFFGMNDLLSADRAGIYETGLDGTEDHNMGAAETIEFEVLDSLGRSLATISVGTTGTTFDDMITELNNVGGLGAYFSFTLESDGQLTYEETASYDGINLKVINDTTDIGGTGVTFTGAFGIGDKHRVEAARDVTINEDITSDPNRLSLAVFDATGAVGDVVLTDGDQRGALAFQSLETSLVGFDSAGELKASNVTLSQYVARFLGNAGLQARRVSDLEADNIALQQEVQARNSAVSGVNMDEELSNLIVYQNAYGAAARVLSSVQDLYDDLLSIV